MGAQSNPPRICLILPWNSIAVSSFSKEISELEIERVLLLREEQAATCRARKKARQTGPVSDTFSKNHTLFAVISVIILQLCSIKPLAFDSAGYWHRLGWILTAHLAVPRVCP